MKRRGAGPGDPLGALRRAEGLRKLQGATSPRFLPTPCPGDRTGRALWDGSPTMATLQK